MSMWKLTLGLRYIQFNDYLSRHKLPPTLKGENVFVVVNFKPLHLNFFFKRIVSTSSYVGVPCEVVLSFRDCGWEWENI